MNKPLHGIHILQDESTGGIEADGINCISPPNVVKFEENQNNEERRKCDSHHKSYV